MNHSFKRRWNEPRGDEYNSWGHSWWFFETDENLWPVRQIEIYDAGPVLCYHSEHIEDNYGGLSEAALVFENMDPFRITEAEFKKEWLCVNSIHAHH